VFLGLCSVYALLRPGRISLGAGLVLFSGSLLAKESGISTIVFFACLAWGRIPRGRLLQRMAALMAVALLVSYLKGKSDQRFEKLVGTSVHFDATKSYMSGVTFKRLSVPTRSGVFATCFVTNTGSFTVKAVDHASEVAIVELDPTSTHVQGHSCSPGEILALRVNIVENIIAEPKWEAEHAARAERERIELLKKVSAK
jgi:hypothetical protein